MSRKKLSDRTFFKHERTEKRAWLKQVEKEKVPNLSLWIRRTLNDASQ